MARHRLVKLWRVKQGAVALGDGGLTFLAVLLAAPFGTRPLGRVFLLAAAWIAVLYAFGLYDFPLFRDRRKEGRWLATAFLANALIAVALFQEASPAAVAAVTALAHSSFLAWRLGWVGLLASPRIAHGVAFLGDSPLIRAMERDLRALRHPGFRVVRWPGADVGAAAPALDRWAPVRAPRPPGAPDVLVIDSALTAEGRRFVAAFSSAVGAGVPAIDDLEFYELLYRKIAPSRAATPEWLMTHVLPRQRLVYPALKRAVDAAGSAAALVALSPLLAAGALLARADGGPALYRQRRVGLLGREFTILKFRTMALGSDRDDPLSDAPNRDPRITRWGRWLRRTRLDELPQLWNVLLGEMSLVGPRPERPEAIAVLQETVPGYHFRHLIKPGITGWAQVNFRATNVPNGTLEKLHYDLYYLKHMCAELDAAILLRTAKRLFQSDESFR